MGCGGHQLPAGTSLLVFFQIIPSSHRQRNARRGAHSKKKNSNTSSAVS